jgi:hypothetical protein
VRGELSESPLGGERVRVRGELSKKRPYAISVRVISLAHMGRPK